MKKGFTLIELLIVISIIGILAGMIIVNLSVARSKARDAKRKADIASIQTAVEMYADRNGTYPSTSGTWVLSGSWGTLATLLTPEFISVLPNDPSQSNYFVYFYKSNGTDYKLLAFKMESNEGKGWAKDDGGRQYLNCNTSGDNDNTGSTCPSPSNPSGTSVTCQVCAYEIFTSGAQGW